MYTHAPGHAPPGAAPPSRVPTHDDIGAIHVVTVATILKPQLANLLTTARLHDVAPVVLGVGDSRMRPGSVNFSIKLEYAKAWLERQLASGAVRDNDLVFVVDGYDVVVTGGEADMRAAYRGLGSPLVVLSGERACYPDASARPYFDARSSSPYRYICAGMFAGRARHLYNVLRDTPELNVPGERDDQRMWTRAFMAHGDALGIVIDTAHALLPSVNGDDAVTIRGKRAPFMHFNGLCKDKLPNYMRHRFPDVPSASAYDVILYTVGAVGVALAVALVVVSVLLGVRSATLAKYEKV